MSFILHPSSFILRIAAIALLAAPLLAQDDILLAPPVPPPDFPGCQIEFALPDTCRDGSIGDVGDEPFSSITKAEVLAIVQAATAAINTDRATIAVVDRTGRPLVVYRQASADPNNDNVALGVARTAAFFSNSQAPLSSRTVRFISQVHFPPGVINAPVGALYGIEQSNRGCELNIAWNTNQCVPRAKKIATRLPPFPNLACNAFDTSGCGVGLITGKILPDDAPNPQDVFNRPVNAGGIPVYRILDASRASEGIISKGKLLGAVGVVGIPGDPQLAEYAAVTGIFAAGLAPLPSYPLPEPQNVFIDGIRLPFLGPDLKLTFNSNGLPTGLERPAGTSPGTPFVLSGLLYGPVDGGCAPNGYLAGPYSGTALSMADVDAIVQRAVKASKKTRAQVRLPLSSYARMVITVVDTDGSILAHSRMPDARFDAVDVVPAKARNVVYFNSNDPAVRNDLPGVPAGYWVTTRTIGFGAQPFYPPGIDSEVFGAAPGPWYSLYLNNIAKPCSQGSQAPNLNQNGVTFFAGSTPLVRNGTLVGGLGVSGDGIEQDDYVTYLAAADLLPPKNKWADQLKVKGVRLPMFKFPRHPEGVTECGGKPCS